LEIEKSLISSELSHKESVLMLQAKELEEKALLHSEQMTQKEKELME
jgi:hypothetical protein